MGSTLFGLVDMGLLGSPMGLLGSPGLISYFILFSVEVQRDLNGRLEGEELAKVIRKVVVETNGERVRRKAKELKENIRNKGDEEIGVVQELVQLCRKKEYAVAGNRTQL